VLPDPISPPRVVRDPDDDFLVALATTSDARAACELLGLPG
jgi:hypothetical protein